MNRMRGFLSLLVLAAVLLAACGGGENTNEKTIYIGPSLVDCVGVGLQKCMQVKTSPDASYTLFYSQIEGFDYQEGYVYQIRVNQETIENPPADSSTLKWTLIEVVEKTPDSDTGEGRDPGSGQEPGSQPKSGDTQEETHLENVRWTLISFTDEKGNQTKILPGSEITADFKAGKINGSAGCNNYFASYNADGEALLLGPVGMTEMYCGAPEGVMAQEDQYLISLQKAASYQIADNQRLQISDGEGRTILTYHPASSAPLTGTSWQLNFYNSGESALVSILNATEITAIFGEDGNLTGSAGCNNYNGAYSIEGKAMTIGPTASTRKFCPEPEGRMEQESAYLAALETIASYQITGNDLKLSDSQGTTMLAFSAIQSSDTQMPSDLSVDRVDETTLLPALVVGELRLTGIIWNWLEFQEMNDNLVVADDPSKYTVEFLPDGVLQVQADCNYGGGSYQDDNGRLTITLENFTETECPPGSLSEDFLRYLGETVSYIISDGRLYLALKLDTGIMEFAPDN